jgi:hypothetical protein
MDLAAKKRKKGTKKEEEIRNRESHESSELGKSS